MSSRVPTPIRDHPAAAAASPDVETRFAALVRDYGRLIKHAVRRVGGAAARNDREDIEQVVLVALWKQLAREQTIDHPASYVYRAAVRETVRAVAKLQARPDQLRPEGRRDVPTDVPVDGERAVEARQQREALAAALRALSGERALAVRAHLAGLSVEEVMQLSGWSYQRARNLIARGMADLRTELRSRGLS